MRFFLLIIFLFSTPIVANTEQQTIIFLRHGEKPPQGYGQLTCQGLNRALLLPEFFKKNFPKADYIFAANPAKKVAESDDNDAMYYYARPLTTIEPTAIVFNMPVNVSIGYTEVEKLITELMEKKYHSAVIYVVWEHQHLLKIARLLKQRFHSNIVFPDWSDHDYNTIFVFTIDWNQKPPALNFKVMSEGFDKISDVCPTGDGNHATSS